jgi:hypothetical protein
LLISRSFSSDEQLTSLCDVFGSTNTEHIQHNERSQTIKIEGKENDVCLWTRTAQLERFVARNVKFSLSHFPHYIDSLPLSLSLSLCLACKSLLCSSDVSILFLSSALAFVKERKRGEDAPSHAREARSIGNDETIAVLFHTKLACYFYWCYSSVAMRDVTPRQLCQSARLHTRTHIYVYIFLSLILPRTSETY